MSVAVAVGREDLPRRAIGVVHPDLVLARVAAGRVHLVESRQSRLLQPQPGGEHVIGRSDLDPGVVERTKAAVGTVTLVESEVERGFGDFELRVAGLHLDRRSSKERLVERNRPRDARDGQREVWSQDSHSLSSSSASPWTK